MRCSNCLSHVDIKSGRGSCANCGTAIDLKFGDGTSAFNQKPRLFPWFRLLSVPGITALLAVLIIIAASLYIIAASRQVAATQSAEARPPEITAQALDSTRFDGFVGGDVVAALNIQDDQRVSFDATSSNQAVSILVRAAPDDASFSEVFELQRDGNLLKRKIPADVQPIAVLGLSDGGVIAAYAATEELIVTQIDADGLADWRRPIFLDGQSVKNARISRSSNTLLVETAMQDSDKTVNYLLETGGELRSLRTYDGNSLPPALLQSDGSVITTALLPINDLGEQPWAVTKTDADGRVVWKTVLPEMDVSGYSKTAINTAGNIYVLSNEARQLVKVAPDGTFEWQRDVGLFDAPEAFALVEAVGTDIVIASIRKALSGRSELNAIGFAADGARSTPSVFDLGLEVVDPVFIPTAAQGLYLAGRATLQTGVREKSVFVLGLDTSLFALESTQSVDPIEVPEPTETVAVIEVPVTEPAVETPQLSQSEDVSDTSDPAAEEQVAGIDWSTNPSAECRFVCLDDTGYSLRMGRTVLSAGGGQAPDISSIHQEICGLAGAVPDIEEAPICEGVLP